MLWLILLLENDLFILLFVKNLNTTDGQNKKFTNLKRILGGTEAVRARQAAVVCWWWLAASSLLLSVLETEFWHAATHALPGNHASTQRIDLSLDVLLLQLASVWPRPRHARAIQAWSSKSRTRQFCFFAKPARNWKHHAMMQEPTSHHWPSS